MPRNQLTLVNGRTTGGLALLLTCEHASNRIPARYGNLGLTPRDLASHIAWDPGALAIARTSARRLGCPLHAGRWSRLLVDLNRSEGHPKLMAVSSFGVRISGNEALSPDEREYRLRRFYRPYREAVKADLTALIRDAGSCLHIGVHTFTPFAAGRERRADVGLLYDPARDLERRIVDRLAAGLAAAGLRVRRNYPYRGVSDGLTTACRRRFPDPTYAGIELEVNQGVVSQTRRIAGCLANLLDSARRSPAEW